MVTGSTTRIATKTKVCLRKPFYIYIYIQNPSATRYVCPDITQQQLDGL